jgi:hypothetical protein
MLLGPIQLIFGPRRGASQCNLAAEFHVTQKTREILFAGTSAWFVEHYR